MSPRMGRPQPGRGFARRRTPAELDTLLDGGSSGDARLDAVLSAARGSARPHELATPAPAVGVQPGPAAPSRSRRLLTRLGAATLVTKVATAVAGAAVVSAAAVAGATHHLPGQHQQTPPSPTPSRSLDSTSASGSRSSGPSRGTSSSAPSTSASVTGSPGAADIPALCRAWLALPPAADAARGQPRFVVLIRAAGGMPAVTGYCRNLHTRSAGATPSSGESHGASHSHSSSGSPSASPSPSTSATASTSATKKTKTKKTRTKKTRANTKPTKAASPTAE